MRVYVSSTYDDLKEHRAAAARALRQVDCHAIAMEDYVASDRRPLERCLDDVRTCQAYVGIFAWRVGFKPTGFDRSITYLEYEAARETGLPCFIFLLAAEHAWPAEHCDENRHEIQTIRRQLQEEHTVSTFTTPDNLAAVVAPAVGRWRYSQKKVAEAPFLLPYLADRSEQEDDLKEALRKHAESSPRRPLLVVVHGDEREAHDAFLRRLEEISLPRILSLDQESQKVSSYRVGWSEPHRSASERLARLRNRVAEELNDGAVASEEQLALRIASHRAPVVIASSIVSTDWQRQEPALIEGWLDYWSKWSDLAPGQRVLVVLSILYKNDQDLDFIRRWRTKRRNNAIRRFLPAIEARSNAQLRAIVLPELKAVRESDVLHWINSRDVVGFLRRALGPLREPAAVNELLLPQVRELFRVEEERSRAEGVPMDLFVKAMRGFLDRALREA